MYHLKALKVKSLHVADLLRKTMVGWLISGTAVKLRRSYCMTSPEGTVTCSQSYPFIANSDYILKHFPTVALLIAEKSLSSGPLTHKYWAKVIVLSL